MTYELGQPGRFHGMVDTLRAAAGATLLGTVGLTLAVEGGAAIGYDIPGLVLEADAGTGIPGVVITPKCPPNSQPGILVKVTTPGASYSFRFKDITSGAEGAQNIPYGESGGFNAPVGDTVVTSYSGGSETDTQKVVCPGTETTTTTLAPTTTQKPTTTTQQPTTTQQATTTTTAVSPVASVPSNERTGTPAISGTTSTAPPSNTGEAPATNSLDGARDNSDQTGGIAPGQQSSDSQPGKASDTKQVSELARGGADSDSLTRTASLFVLAGMVLTAAAQRRRKAAA